MSSQLAVTTAPNRTLVSIDLEWVKHQLGQSEYEMPFWMTLHRRLPELLDAVMFKQPNTLPYYRLTRQGWQAHIELTSEFFSQNNHTWNSQPVNTLIEQLNKNIDGLIGGILDDMVLIISLLNIHQPTQYSHQALWEDAKENLVLRSQVNQLEQRIKNLSDDQASLLRSLSDLTFDVQEKTTCTERCLYENDGMLYWTLLEIKHLPVVGWFFTRALRKLLGQQQKAIQSGS